MAGQQCNWCQGKGWVSVRTRRTIRQWLKAILLRTRIGVRIRRCDSCNRYATHADATMAARRTVERFANLTDTQVGELATKVLDNTRTACE